MAQGSGRSTCSASTVSWRPLLCERSRALGVPDRVHWGLAAWVPAATKAPRGPLSPGRALAWYSSVIVTPKSRKFFLSLPFTSFSPFRSFFSPLFLPSFFLSFFLLIFLFSLFFFPCKSPGLSVSSSLSLGLCFSPFVPVLLPAHPPSFSLFFSYFLPTPPPFPSTLFF